MPAYTVVELEVTDPSALAEYKKVGGGAVAKHGGKMLAGGPNCEILEDTGAGPHSLVLLEWPDADAARNWINDPELQGIHEMRRAGAKSTVVLLKNVA